jgi:hypothetical protein
MPDYDKHLYMIVFPINALVASQLSPEQFAEYYTIGSSKHYEGKVLFAELDPKFRDPHFELDHYLSLTVPHPNGAPKKTKFVSSYGVLEHVSLKALRSLYLVTPEGKALKLDAAPYTAVNEPGLVRIYQQITPLTSLVASTLDQRAFGKYITTGTRSKGAPKVLFTQYELDIAGFLRRNENREMMYCPIPDTNPSRLSEYLAELKSTPDKKTKTISLNSALTAASYRLIRHGFWFAAGDELAFYPMPSLAELEHSHYDWWRSAH